MQLDRELNSSRISFGTSSASSVARCTRYASARRCLIGPFDASIDVAAKISQALLIQPPPRWVSEPTTMRAEPGAVDDC